MAIGMLPLQTVLANLFNPVRPRFRRNAVHRPGTNSGPTRDLVRPNRLHKQHRPPRRDATSLRVSGSTSQPQRKLVKKPPRVIPESAVHRLMNSYDSQINSLRRKLHRTELDVFSERFDKERVIGELLDAETTLTNERLKRLSLEDRMKEIARVTEGLYFDSEMPLSDSEVDSFELDNFDGLPELLCRIRTRVQALHVAHARDFNTIGDLQRELEEMREAFVERELQWYEERRPTLRTLGLLQELQLEYGMALWRQRGMELELLSIHRELDALYHFTQAEHEQIGSIPELRRTVEEGRGELHTAKGGPAESFGTDRTRKGESYESTATAVSRTQTTPKKSVHFKVTE